MDAAKRYRLLGPDGEPFESDVPGILGGNSQSRVYGRLDCGAVLRWVGKGYEKIRVFFADEAAAIAAGYRPCHTCMRKQWEKWDAGGEPGTAAYPWRVTPKEKRP